jgi:CDP-2,3-bis-(O-geranylgeranyl)-sn-glycerol synthase
MPPDPLACALFLIGAFLLSGAVQVAWFRSRWSRVWAIPLDGGRTWRGRRVLGDNKTLRGFVVMVPATAVVFAVLAAASGNPAHAGLWPLGAGAYAALGAWAGLGFMAGELPNSFVKRQLDIAPGCATIHRRGAIGQLLADRADSAVGALAAVALVVPMPIATWAIVLVAGPLFHGLYSAVMWRMGLKERAA